MQSVKTTNIADVNDPKSETMNLSLFVSHPSAKNQNLRLTIEIVNLLELNTSFFNLLIITPLHSSCNHSDTMITKIIVKSEYSSSKFFVKNAINNR